MADHHTEHTHEATGEPKGGHTPHHSDGSAHSRLGLAGRLAAAFVSSKLTPLIILASSLLGFIAVVRTPREEEPQIHVPMIDVMVQMPGATAKEVEQRITNPLERVIHDVPGVEYIYSTSSPGQSLIIVRFYVGEDPEQSLVRLEEKLQPHYDSLPPGASKPILKMRSIDDVPILALTLHGANYNYYTLRQLAERLRDAIKQVPDVSNVDIIGGEPRQVRVILKPARLAAYGLTPLDVANALEGANAQQQSGSFDKNNTQILLRTGDFLRNAEDVQNVVVRSVGGRPIFVRDVAQVVEGPSEPQNYVFFGYGPATGKKTTSLQEAVTLAISKLPSTNAVDVVRRVMNKVDTLKGVILPSDVHITVTRDYGATANEKAMELLFHMLIAVVSVMLLIALALGWRESLIVGVAIPVTLALTLFIFYLYGYTLNRITLFALIFSIGILVDDAIVVVENMVRHFRMEQGKPFSLRDVAIRAVDEVGNPTILATFAVIAAILPMAFVRGLMGPYMRPIPVGASAAMLFSLAVAFIVTPWATNIILGRHHQHAQPTTPPSDHPKKSPDDWTTRLYRRVMKPLIHSPKARRLFFGGVVLLLLGAMSLIALKLVVVKMLPFDNKNEFQLIVDMPNGTTLEQTAAATKALADYIATVPEVANYELYVGTASPYNFNGLVRHYYLRNAAYQADIQVNLVDKQHRKLQSHDIVKRIRPALARIAKAWGVRLKVAEVPPGPPVLETLVAEVYSPTDAERTAVAREVKRVFEQTPDVTDVDWYHDDAQPTYQIVVDRQKAALSHVDVQTAVNELTMALHGAAIGLAHDPEAREDVPIWLQLPRGDRSGLNRLQNLYVPTQDGRSVPLSELVRTIEVPADESIYHKNLLPVVYVTGDVTGRLESPVYAILAMNKKLSQLRMPDGTHLNILSIRQPNNTNRLSMKWDGEWQITYEVFRDLGLAFAVVLILIYILIVGWFRSFITPFVIMAPIPLTLVGILPAHALLGAFFTATSMIGFIAGAGIIVRNSIILVDFIELRLRQGFPLEEAVIEAGATRFRPMLLTAAAVIVGSFVILFDPIFQGLAISLMAGEIASTLLSRLAVPVLYYLVRRRSRDLDRFAPFGRHDLESADGAVDTASTAEVHSF